MRRHRTGRCPTLRTCDATKSYYPLRKHDSADASTTLQKSIEMREHERITIDLAAPCSEGLALRLLIKTDAIIQRDMVLLARKQRKARMAPWLNAGE
eukprot:760875-Pleurochrysis_carterae.AAC.3